MRQEHLAGALIERREITQTSSRSNGVLHYPPEAFDGIDMVPTMYRNETWRKRSEMGASYEVVVATE